MSDLIITIGFLLVLSSAFVIAPLLISRVRPEQKQQALNLAFTKQRLSEIQAELESQQINQDEFEQLKHELELQLLQEQSADVHLQASHSAGRWLIMASLIALPATSFFMYTKLGASDDVVIKNQLHALAQQSSKPSLEQLKTLQQALNERVAERPDNHNYRMLLAEMAMQEQDYQSAITHFAALVAAFPQDVQAQSYLTQAHYLQAGEQITPAVQGHIDRSLSLSPKQSPVLNLLAMHAFKQGDYAHAIEYWQTLLQGAPANSQQAQMMQQGIRIAQQRLGGTSKSNTDTLEDVKTPPALIEVRIDAIENALKNKAKSVFVIVKALNGPPMPLAVKRLALAQLPLRVSLSDADAMMADLRLSQFKQLKINARISESAASQPGDWQSGWQSFELKADTNQPDQVMPVKLKLHINQAL